MSDYTVWWIDDNDDRGDDALLLENHVPELTVEFSDPNLAIRDLNNGTELAEFDLVLIDWKLNEHGDFLGKGLTMAGKIREELPDVPIYGFSDAPDELRAAATQDQFEATFDVSEFDSKEGANAVKQDLDAYATIDEAQGKDLQALIDTLDAPSQAKEDIQSVIPREYSNGLPAEPKVNGGSVLAFADWVRNRFLRTPGPLWSDRWLATKIGLEEDAMEKYADELSDAIDGTTTYTGVFNHRSDRRWWATLAIDAVVSLAQEQEIQIGELTTVAETVLGESEQIAECRVCQDERPDILAAGREGENATAPVHLACSHIHHTREGAFEDYRVADNL